MSKMWLIKKLWWDSMENRNPRGYSAVAYTADQKLVDALRTITKPISDEPYALLLGDLGWASGACEKGVINMYRISEIKEVTLKDMDTI